MTLGQKLQIIDYAKANPDENAPLIALRFSELFRRPVTKEQVIELLGRVR